MKAAPRELLPTKVLVGLLGKKTGGGVEVWPLQMGVMVMGTLDVRPVVEMAVISKGERLPPVKPVQ